MKIVVAYIAVTGGPLTADYAARFVSTYHDNPPGIDHATLIICNGGPLPQETGLLFEPLRPAFFPRQNDPGWDISGFMAAARGPAVGCDMLVCFGESVYFIREGWLRRLAEAWEKHGPGLYGCLASYLLRPHLVTTAFAVSPDLLLRWPDRVFDRRSRYLFEHGPRPFWRMVQGLFNRPAMLVTWDGEWTPDQWRVPQNILFRGDQSNALVWCNHIDRYREAPEDTKRRWSSNADRVWV